MLHEKNIICMSSIDWDFIWQGHQEIMSTLAGNGNRVLFIENTGVRAPRIKDAGRLLSRFQNWKKGFKGIRKVAENLYVYSPLALPFPYSKIATMINKFSMLSVIKKWMDSMEFHDPIVWTFLPTPIVQAIVGELNPSIFIYYCIDDFASSSKGARKIKKTEEKVIKQADLVFTTSHKLRDRCARLNKNTFLFPFGVSIDHYNEARDAKVDRPDDMPKGNLAPIIGYVGGIHKWVDLNLLKEIALKHHGSIVLVGPEQIDLSPLRGIKNIHILGKKQKEELPSYVKFFDVGIIPYLKTKYTDNVYPTKINEYLAMGKPIISTKIPEVVALNNDQGGDFINLIEDEKDFRAALQKSLSITPKEILQKRINVAKSNSWAFKIEKMCDLIGNKLVALQQEIAQDWAGRFRRFYAKNRKKALTFAGVLAILYFILFYSPFIWLIASPLKISEKPKKADAIVVFGGGVGEGGSPGKSTIERARFSADLYNQGFAKYIIYSSGYTWKYNDAENMKLIAKSMGVPEKNIILDKKGDITYRNVNRTTEILREKNFDNIILITSPYNMRRASLVYGNIARDIDVAYVPVPDPQFYNRGIRVKLGQIKAILHEYMGIVYYFFRGYI